MEKLTDWETLWQELHALQEKAFSRTQPQKGGDCWKEKAKKFDKQVDQRWVEPDSSRRFLVSLLMDNPGSTLLDIGAGTGKWSVLAAPHALKVTALEPSPAMQDLFREKIQHQGADNIEIITGTWPGPELPAHDYLFASHSMYGVADFRAFVTQMNRTARKGCILLMRAPFYDSVMAAAARRVLGQPYDSPNFQVAYNILLGMDIYPDVVVERDGAWPAWTSDSYDDALTDIKNRLDICNDSTHDGFLLDLLKARLIPEKGRLTWPGGTISALVHWEI